MSADHVVDADMQELREQIAVLTAQRDQLLAALEAVEWGQDGQCVIKCGGWRRGNAERVPHVGSYGTYGHHPDCIVGLALGRKA